MADRPLVSIGMPVYNGQLHLSDALESVLSQDYGNLEVVVIDNASEDDTASICTKFAEADPRIRYLRNPKNIGFLPNFRRVLDAAAGTYFTWLAHDDLLSDPSYISTVVRYLELNPDVVCCHTAFYLLDNELPGSVQTMSFPELDPGRRWAGSRRALFRWPHGWLDSTIYGVFRREEIAQIPFPEWTYKGKPHIFCWEMDVLTALSGAGRIVALPQCLRSYRLSSVSVGKQIGESVSSFDLLVLGLKMKLRLMRRARRLAVPRLERVGLLGTVLANLVRANFRQPYDHRTVLAERERELAMLQTEAAERSQLIDSLTAEIVARREVVRAHWPKVDLGDSGETAEGAAQFRVAGANPAFNTTHRARSLRARVVDFFRPLTEAEAGYFDELNQQNGILRRLCEEQSLTIEGLNAEALRLLGPHEGFRIGREEGGLDQIRVIAGPLDSGGVEQVLPGSGWHRCEEYEPGLWFCWSGPEPTSHLRIPLGHGKDRTVKVRVLTAAVDPASVTMHINGQPIELQVQPEEPGWILHGLVPTDAISLEGETEVRLSTEVTVAPTEVDPDSPDIRPLGIAVAWIEFESVSA